LLLIVSIDVLSIEACTKEESESIIALDSSSLVSRTKSPTSKNAENRDYIMNKKC
jgi:hypothetical protein